MPIKDHPFLSLNGDKTKIILPIRIINPVTLKPFNTFGIIDTGATECAIPAMFAPILGYTLTSGTTKQVGTGNGKTIAYGHKTIIEVKHPDLAKTQTIYTLNNIIVDFLPNLNHVLLGVNGFLYNYELTVNYKKRIFSLIKK